VLTPTKDRTLARRGGAGVACGRSGAGVQLGAAGTSCSATDTMKCLGGAGVAGADGSRAAPMQAERGGAGSCSCGGCTARPTPARVGKARRGTAQRARELAERAVPHFRLGPEGRAYTNMQSRV
jgi:hypothetical protein